MAIAFRDMVRVACTGSDARVAAVEPNPNPNPAPNPNPNRVHAGLRLIGQGLRFSEG